MLERLASRTIPQCTFTPGDVERGGAMGDPLVRRQRPVVMDAFIQFDRLPSGPVRSCFRTNVPDYLGGSSRDRASREMCSRLAPRKPRPAAYLMARPPAQWRRTLGRVQVPHRRQGQGQSKLFPHLARFISVSPSELDAAVRRLSSRGHRLQTTLRNGGGGGGRREELDECPGRIRFLSSPLIY
jgi:hypothetical protein